MHIRNIAVIAVALSAAGCGRAPDAAAVAELVGKARRLDLDGHHDRAVTVYREALDRDEESFDAHYGMGRALDLDGRYDEARQHFERAIELAPPGAREQAVRMMGIAWTFVGDVGQAARFFTEVFETWMTAGNFAAAADVANELGRVYLESGDSDQAESWYRTGYETSGRLGDRPASQIDLADMRWAHAQARIAARRGDAAEADRQQDAVKALLDKEGNRDQQVQYPYLRGYVAFHLEKYQEAVAHLLEADQEDPFILLLLGEASEKLGDAEGARGYYTRVLESSSHAVNNAFARPTARQKIESGGLGRQAPYFTAGMFGMIRTALP